MRPIPLLIVRIVVPLVLWTATFAVSIRHPELHPWELPWALWFAAVSATSWFVGWGMKGAYHYWQAQRRALAAQHPFG